MAREAGVSTTLVSRVLRGKRGNVRFSEETERRIRRIADELGYVPRRDAQNLKHRRSRTVALLSPQGPEGIRGIDAWGNHFLHQLLEGIETACQEHEYNCLYSHWSMEDSTLPHPRIMLDRSVDGVVLTDFTVRSVVDHLLDTGVKCVQIGSNIDPVCEIDRYYGDLESAVRDVTTALYGHGHRRVWLFRPIGFGPDEIERAFLEASRRKEGLVAKSRDFGRFSDTIIEEQAAIVADAQDRPTALICPNGQFAVGLAAALAKRGMQCPRDYCLIAWLNEGWPVTYLPGSGSALSTIDLPYYNAARVAAADLIRSLEAPSQELPTGYRNHMWPCKINWRASCEAAACVALPR
ncbi:MAG: LacI family DNA-binding transcriptional regulator [Planctomycetota bacterium]